MSIIISPYSKKLPSGKPNPKNYPHWGPVIDELKKDYHIIQIGLEGETATSAHEFQKNLSLERLITLTKECQTWISVDNFFPHLAFLCFKPGVVLWGQSDPMIFGYPENINLIKSRKSLRQRQFASWDEADFIDCFVSPTEVIKNVRTILQQGVSI